MRGLLVVLIVIIASACSASHHASPSPTTPEPASGTAVGPFAFDPSNPTKKDTHWHAALGVYNCNHWMGDATGPGIWAWPFATPSGAPARADDMNIYAGMHSHGDGIIHMEPADASDAGLNATVGRYFDYGGWKLSADGYTFLGATAKNGDKCGASPGRLQWAIGEWDGTQAKQRMKVQRGDPAQYKLYDGDIVVIAFLPKGKTINDLGNPPSLQHLAGALGVG